jgi:L-ribulose-5-phosphate 3-epimerase UlaE
MAIQRDDTDERQARLDWMIDEFRAAQKRQLVQRGIALRNRTQAIQQAMASSGRLPRDETD